MNDVPLKRKWDNELVMETAVMDARKKETVEIAARLKNINYPIKDISVATGLSIDEIEKL